VNRERLTPNEWKEWGYRQIWEIPSVRMNKEHPAMFPKELAYRVIRLFTDEGDIVLDPFLGSGTTAVAAVETNRNFIGIERMKKYAEIATKNVQNAQQSELFSADTQKSIITQQELEFDSENLETKEKVFFDIPEISQRKITTYAIATNYNACKDELKL
jgi:DNA modification methylase